MNQAGRPQLPILHQGTAAAAFLSGLSATTTQASIDAAIALADDHDVKLAAELAEKNRLEGSDPNKEKARLSSLARDWKTVEQHATALVDALSAESLQQLKERRKNAAELREAARIASATTFDTEPLTSVGAETWRALWEAAREYSVTEAFHEHGYPYVGDSAVCVLCQQPLTEGAADRLTRFQTFVTDTTSRDADSAAALAAASRGEVAQLQNLPIAVSAAANRLQEGGEQVNTALEWLNAASQSAADVVTWLDSDQQSMPEAVKDDVSAEAANRVKALTDQAMTIDASTFAGKLAGINKSVQDLQDAKALSEARSAIETEVARLAQCKKIEEVRRFTATNAVTTKRVELTETYVTQEVRDRFTRETERLQLRGVTLNRTGRGRESALEHQPTLLGVRRDAGIAEVLSEGEQTALGLAGFLTEVELDASLSGVVFDDPVSSLDATRRSHVAQRLVELAEQRQVVVFTHEITFVHALNKEAKKNSIAVVTRSIQRMGRTQPGLVADELPWQAKDVPQRIAGLEQDLARIKKERTDLADDQYAERISGVAGRLSETLERAVNLHIVNELVDRGTNEVHPTMLKILPKFTQEDHDEYQAAYAKTSSWAARHDNAPEENYVPPTVDEIQAEVTWLRGWHDRVKRYRN